MSEEQERRALDKFGEVIVKKFKDEPLDWFDRTCSGKVSSDADLARHAILRKMSPETRDFIRDCISFAMIQGIHDFLCGLNELGEDLSLTVDGVDLLYASPDINGEIFGEDGWDAQFSVFPTEDALTEKYEALHKKQR